MRPRAVGHSLKCATTGVAGLFTFASKTAEGLASDAKHVTPSNAKDKDDADGKQLLRAVRASQRPFVVMLARTPMQRLLRKRLPLPLIRAAACRAPLLPRVAAAAARYL